MPSVLGYAVIAGIVAGSALVGSLGIKIGRGLPDHAMLLVDTMSETYVTGPCIVIGATDQSYVANLDAVIAGTEESWYEPFVEPMSKREARGLGYNPDRACANADGFISWEPWLFSLLGSRKERVGADGTVLW
jgi:hypothetical protein